jgi:hypothetical protein
VLFLFFIHIIDSDILLSAVYNSSNKNMSSTTKLKTDVDQLDDLVKDLLSEVHRPASDNTKSERYSYQRQTNNDSSNPPQRSKITREERIRIKRGVGGDGGTDIPITTQSSSSMTTTTTTKPQISSSSIDEQLIDSLLESVQNTLKKRAQRTQSNWTDIPIHNRRAYSSSAAHTDSIHRVSLFIFSFFLIIKSFA